METARNDDSFETMMDDPDQQDSSADSSDEDDMKDDAQTIDEKPPNEFSAPRHFSDVVLVVEGTRFHVHKSTLSKWSPVFETMFTGQFKESTAVEISLPEKRADEVEQLLKMIYSDDAKQEVTETNYEFLLGLAREYQMDKVQQYCAHYMKQGIDKENCLHRYNVAEHFELEDVMEKCIEEACLIYPVEALEKDDDFHDLESETKLKLCMSRTKELEKALKKYFEVCSKLVADYYKKLSADVSGDGKECENITSHKSRSIGALLRARPKFDGSCGACRKRIKAAVMNVKDLDDYFIKLEQLEEDDKAAKIIKNMGATAVSSESDSEEEDSPMTESARMLREMMLLRGLDSEGRLPGL